MIIKLNTLSKLIVVHFLAWLVAQLIYVPMGISGDQDTYLSGSWDSLATLAGRTAFTKLYYGILSLIFPGIFAPLVTTCFVALAIYYSSKQFLPWININLFWLVNLFPHFLIWSSLASKEALFIIPAMYIVSFCASLVFDQQISWWQLRLYPALLVFLYFMRPTYAVGYGYLLVSSFMVSRRFSFKVKQFNFIRRLSLYSTIALFVFIILVFSSISIYIISDPRFDFLSYMSIFQSYFLSYDGATNRVDIEWSSITSFFSNMSWGIPFSLIGFTPFEVLANIKYLPALIEGIIAFLFLIWIAIALMAKASRDSHFRLLVYFCFFPTLFLLILAHYPLGIFNPGSAIRYKQSLAPALYFYPMFLFSMHAKKIYFAPA
jgi:hypothetical protein